MELLKQIEAGVVNLLGKTAFAQPAMQGLNGMPGGMPGVGMGMPPQLN